MFIRRLTAPAVQDPWTLISFHVYRNSWQKCRMVHQVRLVHRPVMRKTTSKDIIYIRTVPPQQQQQRTTVVMAIRRPSSVWHVTLVLTALRTWTQPRQCWRWSMVPRFSRSPTTMGKSRYNYMYYEPYGLGERQFYNIWQREMIFDRVVQN